MAEIPGDAKHEDDVGDALSAMLLAEEEAVESEPADNAERILDLVEGGQGAEAAKGDGMQFDRQIFPFQKPIGSFEGIYKKNMLACEAKYLIAVTTTAHPAIYIAARKHAMSCVVLVRKGNDHALRHGHALAVTWRLTGLLRDAPADAVAPALDKLQYIDISWAPGASKIIDPFDISKGDKFYEGVNHQYEEAQLDALVTPLVVSSVFCENSAAHDETATRLYLPIRAVRLHEVCTNDFYLLTHYVRSQKDRLFFALRALGATVELLKIRSRPGQPGPAIHVARIFHVTDSHEGLDSQIACLNYIWPG